MDEFTILFNLTLNLDVIFININFLLNPAPIIGCCPRWIWFCGGGVNNDNTVFCTNTFFIEFIHQIDHCFYLHLSMHINVLVHKQYNILIKSFHWNETSIKMTRDIVVLKWILYNSTTSCLINLIWTRTFDDCFVYNVILQKYNLFLRFLKPLW